MSDLKTQEKKSIWRIGVSICGALACACFGTPIAKAASLVLQATDQGQTLAQTPWTLNGRQIRVWSDEGRSGGLTFKPDQPVNSWSNSVAYLDVAYVDQGYGKLDVQLLIDKTAIKPDRFLGLSRSDSGKVVHARMRFSGLTAPGTDGISVRIGRERSEGLPLRIASMMLQETPFDDPKFKFVSSDPWKGPYRGTSVKAKDNTTLKGKVMTGYQGWFRTPNDPDGGGWVHWGNIQEGLFSIDQWPDVSQYPESILEKAAGVKLKSGKQAYLFSSAWPPVVDTHFRWMRENDIDGAFLQRFVSDRFQAISGRPEWVLSNVRAAANREGRIWAIEYDVSGYPDAKLLETLKADWKWFVDEFRLLEDPNYAREGGKPVVFIWGMPFPDRNISPATANAVADFFKNDPKYGGNYLIGGIPGNWRKMEVPWQDHILKYDCVLPWMSQSYAEDIKDLRKLGLSYYAHVKPGFSWANLKHIPGGDTSLAFTPREGGQHYWKQLSSAAKGGSDRMFVGMFDEYDEATAIMPMSDDSPSTPTRPGVGATFYSGPNAREHGSFVRLPRAEIELGNTPPGRGIPAENFFVRMGGRITFPKAGQYTFSVEGAPGDDVELFLNGTKFLATNNLNGAATMPKAVTVNAGAAMDYRLDYRHRTGTGTLRLLWECQGLPRQPVPQDALQDAWGRFITNDGKPSDWWMKLTRMGKEMMNGKREADSPMP
jgi:hypothetical protein